MLSQHQFKLWESCATVSGGKIKEMIPCLFSYVLRDPSYIAECIERFKIASNSAVVGCSEPGWVERLRVAPEA